MTHQSQSDFFSDIIDREFKKFEEQERELRRQEREERARQIFARAV